MNVVVDYFFVVNAITKQSRPWITTLQSASRFLTTHSLQLITMKHHRGRQHQCYFRSTALWFIYIPWTLSRRDKDNRAPDAQRSTAHIVVNAFHWSNYESTQLVLYLLIMWIMKEPHTTIQPQPPSGGFGISSVVCRSSVSFCEIFLRAGGPCVIFDVFVVFSCRLQSIT